MAKKKRPLSQAEIWDDSALLQSWDEAVEEYKVRISPNNANTLMKDFSSTTAYRHAASELRMFLNLQKL